MRTVVLPLALGASASSFAQDLDCASRDSQVCQAVNSLVVAVNSEAGAVVLSPASSRAAFRPANLYGSLLQVKAAATARGCAITGWAGGLYDVSDGVESWQGQAADLGALSTIAQGSVALSPPTWSGETPTREIGRDVGLHNAMGQIAADVDDLGFLAGVWHRRSGKRGVHAALVGACPPGVDAGEALDPWFIGVLSPFGDGSPPSHVLSNGDTCDPTVPGISVDSYSITLAECFPQASGAAMVDSVRLQVLEVGDPLVSIDVHAWDGVTPPDLVGLGTLIESVAAPGFANTVGDHAIPIGVLVSGPFCVGMTHWDATQEGALRTHAHGQPMDFASPLQGVMFLGIVGATQMPLNDVTSCLEATVTSL